MNAPIDTLAFAERFESAGFAHDQARALAAAFGQAGEAGREGLVTKEHLDARLAELENRLGTQIAEVKTEVGKQLSDMKIEIADVKTEVGKQLSDMKIEIGKLSSDLRIEIAQVGKEVQGRLWSTIAIIAGVSTAVSATIGAAMTLIFR